MAGNITCCNLVGSFPITVEGIISISSRISTEVARVGGIDGNLIIGPTIGTVSITAYATDYVHDKCQGRASISIPWIRKYDCDNNKVYFIFAGEGQSSIAGDVDNLARFRDDVTSYEVVNASASSGPASLYEKGIQYDGYGLIYTGGPWGFNTGQEEEGLLMTTGIGSYGPMYLQGFNLQCTPGQIATASYDFVYVVEN